jgi:hypothetical protein
VALAGVVSAFYRHIAMANERFQDPPLLAPKKFAKAIAHPSDRILDVWVLRWVEQISENGPSGG